MKFVHFKNSPSPPRATCYLTQLPQVFSFSFYVKTRGHSQCKGRRSLQKTKPGNRPRYVIICLPLLKKIHPDGTEFSVLNHASLVHLKLSQGSWQKKVRLWTSDRTWRNQQRGRGNNNQRSQLNYKVLISTAVNVLDKICCNHPCDQNTYLKDTSAFKDDADVLCSICRLTNPFLKAGVCYWYEEYPPLYFYSIYFIASLYT